jgi:hypothetical protein
LVGVPIQSLIMKSATCQTSRSTATDPLPVYVAGATKASSSWLVPGVHLDPPAMNGVMPFNDPIKHLRLTNPMLGVPNGSMEATIPSAGMMGPWSPPLVPDGRYSSAEEPYVVGLWQRRSLNAPKPSTCISRSEIVLNWRDDGYIMLPSSSKASDSKKTAPSHCNTSTS